MSLFQCHARRISLASLRIAHKLIEDVGGFSKSDDGGPQPSRESTCSILAAESIPPQPIVRYFGCSLVGRSENLITGTESFSNVSFTRIDKSPQPTKILSCPSALQSSFAKLKTLFFADESFSIDAEQLDDKTVIFSRVTRPSSCTNDPVTSDGVEPPNGFVSRNF